MKGKTKCYLYFGSMALLLCLSLVNYFFTHASNGFNRLASLNLDLQKFYCYKEIHQLERCKELLAENGGPPTGQGEDVGCTKFQGQLGRCELGIKEKEGLILDACWQNMYSLYMCYQDNDLMGNGTRVLSPEEKCAGTVINMNRCIEGVLGQSGHSGDI